MNNGLFHLFKFAKVFVWGVNSTGTLLISNSRSVFIHYGQIKVQYLAQGYVGGGHRAQTSNLQISRHPTLPPEHHRLVDDFNVEWYDAKGEILILLFQRHFGLLT